LTQSDPGNVPQRSREPKCAEEANGGYAAPVPRPEAGGSGSVSAANPCADLTPPLLLGERLSQSGQGCETRRDQTAAKQAENRPETSGNQRRNNAARTAATDWAADQRQTLRGGSDMADAVLFHGPITEQYRPRSWADVVDRAGVRVGRCAAAIADSSSAIRESSPAAEPGPPADSTQDWRERPASMLRRTTPANSSGSGRAVENYLAVVAAGRVYRFRRLAARSMPLKINARSLARISTADTAPVTVGISNVPPSSRLKLASYYPRVEAGTGSSPACTWQAGGASCYRAGRRLGIMRSGWRVRSQDCFTRASRLSRPMSSLSTQTIKCFPEGVRWEWIHPCLIQ
jgi:hypothetical protein